MTTPGPTVLVTDAHTIAAVGVIRALGRAGYTVHACAPDPQGLGLRSRYASAASVCPSWRDPVFLPWLEAYVRRNAVRLLIPSEGVLVALRPAFDAFAPLLAYGDPATIYTALSKSAVYRVLRDSDEGSRHLPPTCCVAAGDPAPSAMRCGELGWPLFVKVDAAQAHGTGDSATIRVDTQAALDAALPALRRNYAEVLVQGFTPGVGVGAFFLRHRGEILAEFMHRRLHEVPHTGGVSSLRESWRHEAIRADALAKLRTLRWEGVAMMEYRWDPGSDRFHFIEMNPRYWGSLHLALHAGVDFPKLQADAFFGRPAVARPGYPLGVRCRHTFPKEVQHVWSRWCDRTLPLSARLGSIARFVRLSCDPRVRSDLWFPGDRMLYLHSVQRMIADVVEAVGCRCVLRPRRGAVDCPMPRTKC